MIVRILTEAQYELDQEYLEQLNTVDNQIVTAIADGDRARFTTLFNDLIALVRDQGIPVPYQELHPSDLILPPPETSFEDAAELFVGEGVVPD